MVRGRMKGLLYSDVSLDLVDLISSCCENNLVILYLILSSPCFHSVFTFPRSSSAQPFKLRLQSGNSCAKRHHDWADTSHSQILFRADSGVFSLFHIHCVNWACHSTNTTAYYAACRPFLLHTTLQSLPAPLSESTSTITIQCKEAEHHHFHLSHNVTHSLLHRRNTTPIRHPRL